MPIESNTDYIVFAITLVVATLLVGILFGVAYFFSASTNITDPEKLTVYECGFDPFSDTRNRFDVKYYLLGILFIVFDLELMYLLPLVVHFSEVEPYAVCIAGLFLAVLTIGFIYEWSKGALEWQ